MAEVRAISWFEKLQYSTTRVVAVAVALVAWVMIGCAVAYTVLEIAKSPTYVSHADISASLGAKENSAGVVPDTSSEQATYRMPPNLKDYFTGDNKKVLDGWLEDLDVAQQQDFLDNLSQIVASSPTVPAAEINKYKDLKLAKLRASPFTTTQTVLNIFGVLLWIGITALLLAL